MYPLQISTGTTKESIINFIQSKLIKTSEIAFDEYPVFLNTLSTDIIIIDRNRCKQFAKYSHIYKGNAIRIEINGSWINWGQAKKGISEIIFMDYLHLHPIARHLWSEKGFSFKRFWAGVDQEVKNEILKTWD